MLLHHANRYISTKRMIKIFLYVNRSNEPSSLLQVPVHKLLKGEQGVSPSPQKKSKERSATFTRHEISSRRVVMYLPAQQPLRVNLLKSGRWKRESESWRPDVGTITNGAICRHDHYSVLALASRARESRGHRPDGDSQSA